MSLAARGSLYWNHCIIFQKGTIEDRGWSFKYVANEIKAHTEMEKVLSIETTALSSKA